ncbi:type IV secretory system conjugative DNA transfer family protein [Desulfobacter vibrioformis]|uniref:type IV secretory system conjugative DNA transfer family protein n=1 Tax=Desulfobacter vibrioformis TaxID=34031 RepID=UPI0014704CC8|nr:type IV secretory system conjugative DNA transfer family protein [Desulfobacter vibrioformis]
MHRYDMLKFMSTRKHHGLILSEKYRLSLEDSYKNLCLVAPTGSGKTTRYVIPNLLNLQGSAVVTDPSGEIFQKTSGHLQSRGFRIQVLNPADLSQSLTFNPLHHCHTQPELKQLANTLCPSQGRADAFWQNAAANILHICLAAVVGTKDQKIINLGNVRHLLNHLGLQNDEIHTFMSRTLNDTMFTEYKAFVAQDPKLSANILSTARTALDLWSDPDIVRLTAGNLVDIPALRREPTVIYIITPEEKVRYFSLFINLFYSACFEYCLRHYEPHTLPVFFFLDEFGNLGRINNFAAIATTLRKRRCSISIILQDLAQLKAVYGLNDASTIFSGGMSNKLFFSGMDLETCLYLERVLGVNTAYDVVYGDFSENARTVAKPLMTADEIRMLPKDKGILISGAKRPILLNMKPYFRIPRLNKLTEKAQAEIRGAVGEGRKLELPLV